MTRATSDPIQLARTLQTRLRTIFGPRLRGLVLYGSHARGDATDESDVDLLVLLDQVEEFWRDLKSIEGPAGELSLENDVVVCALPVAESEFRSSQLPLYRNARREGVLVDGA